MDAAGALIALVVGLGGVLLGALLTRNNERRSRGDDLLAQAVNDAIDATADAVRPRPPADARARYASAVARIALHGAPPVVETWRRFQDNATTATDDGRTRMVAAVESVRAQLGHGSVAASDLHVLLFGPGKPSE